MKDFGTIVIGAGFSGLAMGIRLRKAGVADFAILERADDVGGVWRDNTYPGVRYTVEAVFPVDGPQSELVVTVCARR
ncbi:NAD(P)-binding protein [Rhodococcus erythropolis]